MHAHKVPAHKDKVRAHKTYVCTVDARKVHAYKVHAHKVSHALPTPCVALGPVPVRALLTLVFNLKP